MSTLTRAHLLVSRHFVGITVATRADPSSGSPSPDILLGRLSGCCVMSDPLTREQVERACTGLLNDAAIKGQIGLTTTIVLLSVHDAARRALLRQREEEIDKLNGELHDKDVVPRSRYDACNKDWLEAEQKVREVGGAAIKEIELLRAQLAAMTAERDALKGNT